MGPDAMILLFWMLSFKPAFSLFSFTFIERLFSSSSLSAIKWFLISARRCIEWQRSAIIVHVSPPSSPASPPSKSSGSARLAFLGYRALSRQLCFMHGSVYMSVHPILSSLQCVHKFILYICIVIPSLQIDSSILVSRFHIYTLIYFICFSLSDLLHSV